MASPALSSGPVPDATENGRRRTQLISASRAYFEGLLTRNLSHVPWAEDVSFREPLCPGGVEACLAGRAAVLEWFACLDPPISQIEVLEHYFNHDLTVIVTRANLGFTSPHCTLRVLNRFRVLDGKIIEQENHYDLRPALRDTW